MDNQGESYPPDYYFDHITIGDQNVKYYMDAQTGKIHKRPLDQPIESAADRLRKGPPSENQLNRIKQLKDMPEFAPHLDWLLRQIEQPKSMLATFGQAGMIISEMKKRIKEAGGITP